MPQPRDQPLYDRIKKRLRLKLTRAKKPWSAYASGQLVKLYKTAYKERYPKGSPYVGKKPSKYDTGLQRWFAENWKSDTG